MDLSQLSTEQLEVYRDLLAKKQGSQQPDPVLPTEASAPKGLPSVPKPNVPVKPEDAGFFGAIGNNISGLADMTKTVFGAMGQMTPRGALQGGGANAAVERLAPLAQGFNQATFTQPAQYAQQTGQAMVNGNPLDAIKKAPGMIPQFGPWAEDVTNKAQEGRTGEATGDALFGLALAGAPELKVRGGQVGNALWDRMTAVEPVEGMTRALKPGNRNFKFEADVKRSLPELKLSEREMGRPVTNAKDLYEAANLAKKRVWADVEKVSPEGASVNLADLAKELRRNGNAEGASQVGELVREYKSNSVRLDRLEADLKDLNAKLDSYYAKNPAARSMDARKNPDTASMIAQAEARRQAIYNFLDSENGGAGIRELKQRYGGLMNIVDALEPRMVVEGRLAPESLTEQLSKVAAAMRMVKGGGKLLTGRPEGALDILEAITGRQVAKTVKGMNRSDSLIERAMRAQKGLPTPIDISGPSGAPSFGPLGPPNILPSSPSVSPDVMIPLRGARKTTADVYSKFGSGTTGNPIIDSLANPDVRTKALQLQEDIARATAEIRKKYGETPSGNQIVESLKNKDAKTKKGATEAAIKKTTADTKKKFGG